MADLEALRSDYSMHKEDTTNKIINIYGLLDLKADKLELEEVKNTILEHLQKMVNNLKGNFASKEDMSKKLNILTRKIKELYELIQGGT